MRAPLRPLELVRAGWGLALLGAPGPVVGLVAGGAPDRRALVVARVLGARHVVQAVASGPDPGPAVLAVGAWVDLAHALTCLALAAVDPSRRRPALVDATIASTFGALTRRDAGRSTPGPGARRSRGSGSWVERVAAAVLPVLPLARPAHR